MSWTESPHIVLATVIERGGQFLMVEELADGEQVLNQPAGHWEPGETFVEGAIRETLEETAWQVRIDALLGVYVHHPEGLDYPFVRIAFIGTPDTFDKDRKLDTGILRSCWMTDAELREQAVRHRSPMVQRCIDDYRAGCRLPLSALAHL
ncbi:NUDIX hydrolase [Polycyclovorans algicola]|uniref:NUDIX hydrolase n=1 Tax=Polycyclovorans algicola TaxID=616992 RepID=UPI0004A740BB|nr:NUDIX hydrolase [Polycyclovorans algicola]